MKKILLLAFPILFLLIAVSSVLAQNANSNIPEKNGDYPDPAHPKIRVRVFVHEPARGRKPSPNPTPTLSPVQCSDNPSSEVDGTTGWILPSTVSYYTNESSVPSSVGTSLTGEAQNAFERWTEQITSGAPAMDYVSATSVNKSAYDKKNIITFGRTQGTALAVTYIRYDTSSQPYRVVDVDTIMNLKFAWTSGCFSNTYDVSDILTHELGHWYGLDDEYTSNYSENTMYGYGATGERKKVTPEEGDRTAINSIYY